MVARCKLSKAGADYVQDYFLYRSTVVLCIMLPSSNMKLATQ